MYTQYLQDYRKAGNAVLPSSKSMVSMEKFGEEGHGEDEGHGDPTLIRTGR